jgi:hypothetical protein
MPLGITKGIGLWNSQQMTVERFTDNAAYTSAHPDDTLVLAGPPRLLDVNQGATRDWNSLLAIGMVQGFQFTSQKPTQPLQAIGSGRSYFVSGKSQTTWRIGRLFCNGRNLLRVLYHNAVAGGVQVQTFDDPAAAQDPTELYYINLDSELFYVPFGLSAIFRDKMRDLIGAVYLELCMVQTYGVGFNAGQQMVMEDVSGMCDRILPFHPTSVATMGGVPRETVDAVIGFAGYDNSPTAGNGLVGDYDGADFGKEYIYP